MKAILPSETVENVTNPILAGDPDGSISLTSFTTPNIKRITTYPQTEPLYHLNEGFSLKELTSTALSSSTNAITKRVVKLSQNESDSLYEKQKEREQSLEYTDLGFSSDEEYDIKTSKVIKYDLLKSWNKLYADKIRFSMVLGKVDVGVKPVEVIKVALSFVCHAWGIKLFYSDSVKEAYRGTKGSVTKLFRDGSKIIQPLQESASLLSNNSTSFLANIMVSNRSEKLRREKLLKNSTYIADRTVYRTWAFSPLEGISLERQIIGMDQKKNFNRSAWVDNLDSYSNVLKALKVFQQNMKSKFQIIVSDSDIAEGVRDNINGKIPLFICEFEDELSTNKYDQETGVFALEEAKRLIADLSYLLFGLEVARNPASLIINQIMLDMIIYERLGTGACWTEMFGDEGIENDESRDGAKRMPMAKKGAMAAARLLEKHYSPFMPKDYKYEGSMIQGGITSSHLAFAEGEIALFWLKALFIQKGIEQGECYEWGKKEFDDNYMLRNYTSCPKRDYTTKVIKLAEEYILDRVSSLWYEGTYLQDIEKEIDKLPMSSLSI